MSETVLVIKQGTTEEQEVTLDNFTQWFDGYCEEKETAGRHFSGNCTWDFDLTEEQDISECYRGMYYLHGYADGDWGTDFSDYDFVSNEQIQQHKEKQPITVTVEISGEDKDKVASLVKGEINTILQRELGLNYTFNVS